MIHIALSNTYYEDAKVALVEMAILNSEPYQSLGFLRRPKRLTETPICFDVDLENIKTIGKFFGILWPLLKT